MPPVQDELTLTTKNRLQNLRRRSLGLQQLAVREISKQLTFYRTHPEELEKLKSLPGVLRDKILQVLMKKRCLDWEGDKTEFENLKEIFPLLLSPRTRYIELNGILSFFPGTHTERKTRKVSQWCVELLKQIETRAPQVETLIINQNNPFYMEYSDLYDPYFSKDMVQSLMKMQKLKRLNVNLYIVRVTDLLKICKNISSLQYINIGYIFFEDEYQEYGEVDKDLPAPEEVLSSFGNLKEIVFQFPRFEWLGCFCIRNLPNIQVVQHDPNKIMDWYYFIKYSGRYKRLNFPEASNLRLICVDLKRNKAKKVEAMTKLFPNVTCLMVKNIKYSSLEVLMPKFDNIRQLHLFNPRHCSDVIEKYLVTYGQKLQSLYLGNAVKNSSIDLESIFKYCPKLKKLSLLNVDLKTTSKIEFFAELNELEYVFDFYNDKIDAIHENQIMVLSSILRAPKLEKIKLDVKNVNQNDLLIVNSLIQEKRILKNLQTLHVYCAFPMHEALAHVLKSACAFLPKLTDFRFGLKNPLLDPLIVICQSTPFGQIDDSVYGMNAVFDNEN